MVKRYAYSPYGEPSEVDDNGNLSSVEDLAFLVYGFQGLAIDEETGYLYVRNRMFDPQQGRFLQRDPLEYTDSMGLYAFADNSPMDFTDPMGKGPIKIVKKVIEKIAEQIAKHTEKLKEIRRQAFKEQKKNWEKKIYELPKAQKDVYPTVRNIGKADVQKDVVPKVRNIGEVHPQKCPPQVDPKDPSTLGGFIAGIGWWDVVSTVDPTGATDVIDALGWVAENYTPEEKKIPEPLFPFDMHHGNQPQWK
ncbi:MAG: RHS repeat-associated core domain-containing protein [Spirochaetota bacterium]